MQPTPTRSPTWNLVTLLPVATTVPIISWPGTIGKMPCEPHSALTWCRSEWQMPQYSMSMATSLSRGERRSMVCGTTGVFGPRAA